MPTADAGVSALLDLAADLMEQHGWRTGEYFDVLFDRAVDGSNKYVGGAMCTEGAIRAASTMIWASEARMDLRELHRVRQETVDAFEAVCELAPRIDPDDENSRCIPWWNDHVCASKEEAISVLRDAATKTRPDAA